MSPTVAETYHLNGLTSVNFHLNTDNYAHIFYVGNDADGHWWLTKATLPLLWKIYLRSNAQQ